MPGGGILSNLPSRQPGQVLSRYKGLEGIMIAVTHALAAGTMVTRQPGVDLDLVGILARIPPILPSIATAVGR